MDLNQVQIRETVKGDFDSIMEVEKLAFGCDNEAVLTADLLNDGTANPIVSLLAVYRGEPVGHILFTRAYFSGQKDQGMMHILAPLAVKPDFQRQGIGGMLIKAGIERLQAIGSNLVFVLGHKEYYPKFGFIPDAKGLGYPTPYPILEENREYWMVQPIGATGFDVGKGKIECCEVLNRPEHWRDDESDK